MKSRRKTWSEKLETPALPEVKTLDHSYGGMAAGGQMLIPTPRLIQAYLRTLPTGSRVDMSTLRRDLARAQGADGTCPMTAGIFLRIVAEVAIEQLNAGKDPSEVAPFWRVVSPQSAWSQKLSIGPAGLEALRRSAG